MKKIAVSAVSYTNTLPFLQGIRSSAVMDKIDLSMDYPSECARRVIEGEVDMGIIPIAALLNLPEYHIIGDYCIGSDGAVNSVFIYSQKPAEKISMAPATIATKIHWRADIKYLLSMILIAKEF